MATQKYTVEITTTEGSETVKTSIKFDPPLAGENSKEFTAMSESEKYAQSAAAHFATNGFGLSEEVDEDGDGFEGF